MVGENQFIYFLLQILLHPLGNKRPVGGWVERLEPKAIAESTARGEENETSAFPITRSPTGLNTTGSYRSPASHTAQRQLLLKPEFNGKAKVCLGFFVDATENIHILGYF